MFGFHSAKSEDAGEFKLADGVAIFFAQVLPLELQPHGCHVLDCLADQSLHLVDLLLGEDGH